MSVEVLEFEVHTRTIPGLLVVRPKQVTDERGTVRELFRRSAFEAAGVDLAPFQQINVTESARGVLRGMHAEDMTKLLTVASGEALGAYVDLRSDSPTFGMVETVELRLGVQVLLPAGVANGFQALTDGCQYVYCFDAEWHPGMAGEVCSPLGLGVEWPLTVDAGDPARLSVKDAAAPDLAAVLDRLRQERSE
jgi:dTDP-4-dehydrorhamnose 3,5-epimerase